MLTLVRQLVPVPPGQPDGGLNCGAAAGAVCVIHATSGQHRPSASDVRALCREPDGRPDVTGGLNLRQVADAVDRGWGVQMQVITPSQFATFRARMQREPNTVASIGIWYGALVGSSVYASRNGFVGNHQVVVQWRANGWDMSDSLADGRGGVPLGPVRISDTLLRRAAGALQIRPSVRLGLGKVYVGYVRGPASVKPKRYAVAFTPGSFHVYSVQGGVAIARTPKTFMQATSAPCEAPMATPYPTPTSATRRLAKIKAGALAGQYVEAGRAHVRLLEYA